MATHHSSWSQDDNDSDGGHEYRHGDYSGHGGGRDRGHGGHGGRGRNNRAYSGRGGGRGGRGRGGRGRHSVYHQSATVGIRGSTDPPRAPISNKGNVRLTPPAYSSTDPRNETNGLIAMIVRCGEGCGEVSFVLLQKSSADRGGRFEFPGGVVTGEFRGNVLSAALAGFVNTTSTIGNQKQVLAKNNFITHGLLYHEEDPFQIFSVQVTEEWIDGLKINGSRLQQCTHLDLEYGTNGHEWVRVDDIIRMCDDETPCVEGAIIQFFRDQVDGGFNYFKQETENC